MPEFFLDTSTVLTRYVVETVTPWVQAMAARAVGDSLIIVRVLAETFAAINRRERGGTITPRRVGLRGQTDTKLRQGAIQSAIRLSDSPRLARWAHRRAIWFDFPDIGTVFRPQRWKLPTCYGKAGISSGLRARWASQPVAIDRALE